MAHGATWMAGRHNGRVLVRHMVTSAGPRCDHGKPAVESDYIRLELCFPCWNLGLGEHRRGTSPWLCAGFHRISSHIYLITYNIARREATRIWVTGISDYSALVHQERSAAEGNGTCVLTHKAWKQLMGSIWLYHILPWNISTKCYNTTIRMVMCREWNPCKWGCGGAQWSK